MAHIEPHTTCFGEVKWVDVSLSSSDVTRFDYNTNEYTTTSSWLYVYIDNTLPCDETKTTVSEGADDSNMGLLLLLPTHILHDILARLPIEDLIRCRIVCKSLNRLTKDPGFVSHQLSKAILQPHSFLLKQTIFDHASNLFLVNCRNNKWTTKEIPLKKFHQSHIYISDSYHGMLCISAIHGEDPIIYNPITKDRLTLPKSDLKPQRKYPTAFGFAFGFDSSNNKYKVVRVYNVYHDIKFRIFHTKGEIHTLGESSWRSLDFPHKVSHSGTIKSVFLNDAFHWGIHREKDCSHVDYILVFNIISEKFQTIQFPPSVKIPEAKLELVHFGKSLALVNNSSFNRDPPQVWQILGNMTDGGSFYRYDFDISVIDGHFNRGIGLLAMLDNGDFLYNAFQAFEGDEAFAKSRHHLVRYSPQKNRGFLLEIPRLPRWKGGKNIKLEGSDHVPVYVSLREIPDLMEHNTPSLAARYDPKVHGSQQTIVSFLSRRQVNSQVNDSSLPQISDNNFNKGVCVDNVISISQDCSASMSTSLQVLSSTNQESEHSSSSGSGEISKENILVPLRSEAEKRVPAINKKSNKKARNCSSTQLMLGSYFQKKQSLNVDTVLTSANLSPIQGDISKTAPDTSLFPEEMDSCKAGIVDDGAMIPLQKNKVERVPSAECNPEKEKQDVALQEWQRIQQLMLKSKNVSVCKGHNGPCVARVVKKEGPNFGRKFYVCHRAQGLHL